MTRLRRIMLEELQRRNYSAITTRNYLRVVADFAKHFGKSPDKLGLNELRTYQAYLLRERKLTPGTVINQVAALRFFFVKTLKRHQFRDFLPYPQDQRRLPTVLSREEVSRLINAAGTLFRRTLLMTSPRCSFQPSREFANWNSCQCETQRIDRRQRMNHLRGSSLFRTLGCSWNRRVRRSVPGARILTPRVKNRAS